MTFSRTELRPVALAVAALLWPAAAATCQTRIAARGLCNTGLTPASALPAGCSTSTPVTPVNPDSGGPSVDGNWQLATPYPSIPAGQSGQQGPIDPCILTTYGPAWVDAPEPDYLNPNDGLSQWIMPEVEGEVEGGWYVYRTALPVPPAAPGATGYLLTVVGRLLSDDQTMAIFLQNPGGACKLVSMPDPQILFAAWNPFAFAAGVAPNSSAYLYFVVYNNNPSPTGLRVEFTSAHLTAE